MALPERSQYAGSHSKLKEAIARLEDVKRLLKEIRKSPIMSDADVSAGIEKTLRRAKRTLRAAQQLDALWLRT